MEGILHRTNFLLGHPYGTGFVYNEMMVAPGFGEVARVTTETFARMLSLFGTGGLKPGAGPTREEREKGFYDILFLGELPDGGRIEAVVTGDRDPGLRLDQQDDRRKRSLPRARRAGRGRHMDAGRADGAGVAQASEGARRPHLQRSLR
jgi:hypothetical protein